MALNPKVFPHGMPIPFLNELFVFAIDGVDFEIDNIPCLGEVQAKGTIYLSNIRMVFVAKNPKDNFIAFDIPLLHISNIARVEFLHLCLFYRLLGETVGALNSVVEGRLSPEATCKAELLCRHKALRLFYLEPGVCRKQPVYLTSELFVHGERLNQPIFFCKNISGYVNPVAPDNENSGIPHSFKILFKECDCESFISLFFDLIGKVRRRYRRSREKHRVDPLHEPTKIPVDEMTRYAYVDPNDPTSIFLQQTTPESQLRCRRTCQSQPSSGAELGSAKGLGQTPFAGKLVDVGSLLLLHVITSLYLESP
ncbi:putative transcription factor TCP7-like [Capsicum annuum]|nr:putative transcription factor TCP7-like [Capsicum annuum]KAF3676264.1 putative transcription factor TCP7-like [Capsicum annuum]